MNTQARKRFAMLLTSILLATSMAFPVISSAKTVDPSTITVTEKRTLTTSATASIELDPDMAQVTLGITNKHENPAKASDENGRKMKILIDALKKSGIKSTDIRSNNLSIYQSYDYYPEKESSKEAPKQSYQVDNSVIITVRDISTVGDVINTAMNSGANSLNYISFELKDKDSGYEQATKEATKKAIQNAKKLADAAEVSVGKLMFIGDSPDMAMGYYDANNGGMNYNVVNAEDSLKGSDIGSTISAGKIKVVSTVSLTCEILDK